MVFSLCVRDFYNGHYTLVDSIDFNRLIRKRTSLTVPSVICYVRMGLAESGRFSVLGVTRCYISENPAADIDRDAPGLGDDIEILIHPNTEHSRYIEANNLNLSDGQRDVFHGIVAQVERAYEMRN